MIGTSSDAAPADVLDRDAVHAYFLSDQLILIAGVRRQENRRPLDPTSAGFTLSGQSQ